ncbi:MAG: hypothetical protein AB7O26_15820, partial [Planctomycetaceae bacterium]
MSNTHRIHLKGPWECRWLGAQHALSDPAAEVLRVKMPAEWKSIFGEQAGIAQFTRRFHKPTGLEPRDSVWLLFDGIGGGATVRINGEVLAIAIPPFETNSRPSL